MEEFLLNIGLPAMFFVGILAATVLPIGSEWLLIALIISGSEPTHIVIVATAGNYLGACTTYMIGIWGGNYITTKILRINEQRLIKAKAIYKKYGVWSLLFSWVPIIGDPLCLAGGVMRTNFYFFSTFVITGKFLRYLIIAKITVVNL